LQKRADRSLLRDAAFPSHAPGTRYRQRDSQRQASAWTDSAPSHGRHAATARVERAAATSRVCFECLSSCVSLGQREFGLSGRDCRTTKMRERDTRAAIAANAAQIRLGV